ncbi:ABC transporter permease [Glaciimonas sp. PCH181]|uniref:ABC transporter permease n=1 Tax=Glaciimonas sp. PCH181 TaxID=2133943 RepID=UPI000D352BA8|nr:ABC transporter permease [Glaciimonas sp. PCH181]PUA18058.1 choline ABC transporter permease [Glaciimonas sp. PCH181]
MEIFTFIWNNLTAIGGLTIEHLKIVGLSVAAAILTGVPLGILISTDERLAKSVLYVASVIMTIPSVALFGIMIPVLSYIGQGIGFLPAVIALFLYAQLPIIRNTYTAIKNIDPALREAANGMGMTVSERLRKVEIPIALPIIMAGVRMAVVINVGIATIAAYIGAGGLGQLISRGIAQSDTRQIIAGAILVSVLAIAADYGLAGIQRLLTPKGLRIAPSRTGLLALHLLRTMASFSGLRKNLQT